MTREIPILGVAGRPVLHSMSPILFRELFRASGDEAAYTRIAASSAAEAVGLFRSLEMRGMNLTAPFKEAAVTLVDELTPDARVLGAVNCLVPLEGGRVLGANTDAQGVMGALRGRGVEIAGRRCLVIGAGGAGKAAARALVAAGGEVVVANRTRARAEEVAAAFGCASAGLDELAVRARDATVIVSTLASDALPDPETWLPDDSGPGAIAVLDADYKWGVLARCAAERGLVVATGADWLACQALPAYELFMGKPPAASPSSSVLAASLSRAPSAAAKGRKLALVGLMGAGKTQTGKVLAPLFHIPFIDADGEIEADAGMTVSDIFAREGESGFRARERRILERIISWPGPAVLATGGGAPTFPSSASLLKERCLCVWLHVSPETAAGRTRGGAGVRPLLASGEGAGDEAAARLRVLEAERRGAYASCAELLVSTEGREAREVAEVIHDEIDRIS
ncbi:MAG: shikimate kinase [Rectinemataceae bacterium]|jgi:shikimate dehydrogenase